MPTLASNHDPSQSGFDEEQVRRAFALFATADGPLEVRAPDAGKFKTISGYFEDADHLVQALKQQLRQLNGTQVPAWYITLNPAKPDLLARAANRLKRNAKNTTANEDIVRRRFLFVDVDAVRSTGISSTDQEHENAIETAKAIREWLRERGWPEPVVVDSGNGAQLLYRIA